MRKLFLFISIIFAVAAMTTLYVGATTLHTQFVLVSYTLMATSTVFLIIANRYPVKPVTRFRVRKEDLAQLIIALPALATLAYSLW